MHNTAVLTSLNSADCRDVKGTFGTESSNKWKPWNYQQRVNVANKVNAFKKRVAVEEISEKTKRSKITDNIAKQNSMLGSTSFKQF